MSNSRAATPVVLALLAVAALVVRVERSPAPLASEEIRYVALAQSLAAGRGYRAEQVRYPALLEPPLYPGLVAAASIVTAPEAGARRVSALFGALLVLPVYLLGGRLHSRAAGFFAAFLGAIHPGLLQVSRMALTETTYLFLLLTGIAVTLACLERPHPARALAASLLFSLAYLTRPEGLIPLVFLLGLLLCNAVRSGRGSIEPGTAALDASRRASTWRAVGLAAIAGGLVVATYAVWFRSAAGFFTLAPKGSHTLALVAQRERIEREGGWTSTWELYEKMRFELDEAGENFIVCPLPWDRSSKPDEAAHEPIVSRAQPSFAYLLKHVVRNVRDAYRMLASHELVLPPVLLVLCGLGLAAVAAARRLRTLVLLLVFAGATLAFVGSHVLPRFLLPGVALLLPLAGAGGAAAAAWLAKREGRRLGVPAWASVPLAAAIAAVALLPHLLAVEPPRAADAAYARAGQWLRDEISDRPLVTGISETTAWYAGLPFLPLPSASLERTLAFVHGRNARYLVLERGEVAALRPALAPLLDSVAWRAPDGGLALRAVWSEPTIPPYRTVLFAIEEDGTGE